MKTITKSQLKQMIKEAIREQSKTLNESFIDSVVGEAQIQTGKDTAEIAFAIVDFLPEVACKKILKLIVKAVPETEYEFFNELEYLFHEDKRELVDLLIKATGMDPKKFLSR